MQMSDTHQYGVQTRLFGELSSDLGWIKRTKHFLLLIKKFVDHTKLFRVGDPMNGPQGSSTARTNTCLFLGGAVVLEAPPLLSIYHPPRMRAARPGYPPPLLLRNGGGVTSR